MTWPMRPDEPHPNHGLRMDRYYDCREPRPHTSEDKPRNKSGLDTPAKKQVQTAKKTPPSN